MAAIQEMCIRDRSIGRSDTVGGAGAPVSGCAQKARSVLFICIRCCSGRERGGDCQTCAQCKCADPKGRGVPPARSGNRAASGTTGNRGLWSGRYVLWSDVGACRISSAYSGTGAGCGQPCKGGCTLLDRWNAGFGVQCAVPVSYTHLDVYKRQNIQRNHV